jgi:hypothetical protein
LNWIGAMMLTNKLKRVVGSARSERPVVRWLKSNPLVLGHAVCSFPFAEYLVAEFPFGSDHRADFVLVGPKSGGWDIHLVELEPPNEKLFTRGGLHAKRFREAVKQVDDWRSFIEKNRSCIIRDLSKFAQAVQSDLVDIVILPTLGASTAGGGSVTVEPPAGAWLSDGTAVVTATPAPGWTFLQWLGDATGTNPAVSVGRSRNRSVQQIHPGELHRAAEADGVHLRRAAGHGERVVAVERRVWQRVPDRGIDGFAELERVGRRDQCVRHGATQRYSRRTAAVLSGRRALTTWDH